MADDLVARMRECWKRIDPTQADEDPVGMTTASALLAEGANALVKLRYEHDALVRGRIPTHRCKECGALWIRYQNFWSLFTWDCEKCCNNAAMGDQIEELPKVPA